MGCLISREDPTAEPAARTRQSPPAYSAELRDVINPLAGSWQEKGFQEPDYAMYLASA